LYPLGVQAFDLGPAPITKDQDGVLRVAGTRVTLDSIVMAFDLGATPEEIVQRYPAVDLASAYALIAYVLRVSVTPFTRRVDLHSWRRAYSQALANAGTSAQQGSRRSPLACHASLDAHQPEQHREDGEGPGGCFAEHPSSAPTRGQNPSSRNREHKREKPRFAGAFQVVARGRFVRCHEVFSMILVELAA
jgi:uncharacterized protein (DUF433 family)